MPESADQAAARLVGMDRADPATTPGPADLVDALARANRRLSRDELATLAHAISSGGPVRITYRSTSGSVTDRVISDAELVGHVIEAWCHLRRGARMFLLAEISSVAQA